METWLRHPTEDILEEYARKRLGESEAAPLEEHLLVCEICQAKLQDIDEFVLAMKQAGPAPVPAPAAGSRLNWLALTPGRAALAGAVALLCVVAVVERPRTADGHAAGPPVAITLKALRGGNAGFAAPAPAGRPLALELDVPDIATCAQCRVEIVNDSGRTAWSGNGSVIEGRLTITAPVALGSGVYWVRLYTGEASPAREFGLRLR